jgi:hypothetical protein
MKKLLIVCALVLWPTLGFACSSPVTGKDASGTSQNFGAVVDGSSNCWGGSAIVDGTNAGNKAQVDAGNNLHVASSYFNNVASSTLTRAANTTTYAANETVCLNTSVTTCAPLTISIANTNQGKGVINRVLLLKSSNTTASASFNIWFFSAAPTVTSPAQYDAISYTGPRAADMSNYIGYASCTTANLTSDTSTQAWYECNLQNPNTGGTMPFQALSGSTNINALITVTGPYVPTSGETFNVYVSGWY